MTNSGSRFFTPPNIMQIDPYRPGKPEDELIRELGLNHVIKMASNENCLGPSPAALEAMKLAVTRVHRYPDGNGFYLKKALSEKLDVVPERIILGNGSTDLIEMIARTYLEPGTNTITADQTFLMYRVATLEMNAECKSVKVKDYCFDLQSILTTVNSNTRLIYLANPNNPTGTIIRKQDLEAFLIEVPKQILVVLDEAYFDYVEDPDYVSGLEFLDQHENLIVLRTFSKIYGLAGIRIGYGIACEDIISSMNRIRAPFNTNSVAQAAAIAALTDVEHVRTSKEMNSTQRTVLEKRLSELNIPFVPSVTNFILLPIPNADQIFKEMLLKGIIVRSMRSLNCDDGLRVTIGKPDENQAFLDALSTLMV